MKRFSLITVVLLALVLLGCVTPPTHSGPQVTNGTITSNGKISSNGLIISTNYTTTQGAQVVPILPAATSGHPYNALISVTGGSGPYSCSPAPGTSLPGQLVFQEPGCTISGTAPTLPPGTPSAVYPLSFVVTDSAGTTAGPITFNLIVNKPSMIFTVTGLPDGAVGQPYIYSFCQPALAQTSDLCEGSATNPTNGQPPYHFVLNSGTGFPPMGLILHPNGILDGTPSSAGDYTFSVCAVDETGDQKCADAKITVKQPAYTYTLSLHITSYSPKGFVGTTTYDIDPTEIKLSPEGYNRFVGSAMVTVHINSKRSAVGNFYNCPDVSGSFVADELGNFTIIADSNDGTVKIDLMNVNDNTPDIGLASGPFFSVGPIPSYYTDTNACTTPKGMDYSSKQLASFILPTVIYDYTYNNINGGTASAEDMMKAGMSIVYFTSYNHQVSGSMTLVRLNPSK